MTDLAVAARAKRLNLSIRGGVAVIVTLPMATSEAVLTLASATELANREHPRTAHAALPAVGAQTLSMQTLPIGRSSSGAVTGLSGRRS